MRFNAFTVTMLAITALVLAGLGSWVYFAHAVQANPADSLSDTLALVSIWTSIIGTGLVTYYWDGYFMTNNGVKLRFKMAFVIFLAAAGVVLINGLVGFVYAFGVLATAVFSIYWGFVTTPGVDA